jgi:hypothetical protein
MADEWVPRLGTPSRGWHQEANAVWFSYTYHGLEYQAVAPGIIGRIAIYSSHGFPLKTASKNSCSVVYAPLPPAFPAVAPAVGWTARLRTNESPSHVLQTPAQQWRITYDQPPPDC